MPLIHRGVVTSLGKMNKTVTVTVPYKKFVKKHKVEITQTKKYLAHDDKHLTHLDDMVTIVHTVPKYSPRKAFRISEIHRQGKNPADYAQPDPAWKRVMEKRAAEDAAVRQRYATSLRQEERARRLSASSSDFLGELADVGRPPRRITGEVEAGQSGTPLGVVEGSEEDAEAENIEESDAEYEEEVEGHEEEDVVQGKELDREIEDYERLQAATREEGERDQTGEYDSADTPPEPPTDAKSERNDGSEDGDRR